MDVAGVNGVVLTKLDGTAKGGVAVAIANDLKLPIRYVGVGEGIDDLDPVLARRVRRPRCSRRSGRQRLMRAGAARCAARGRGRTSPNPMVGATIVAADGTIVGDGWHQRAGDAARRGTRARQAGDRAARRHAVCTLEPCCHHGRTGTRAWIASSRRGITRVVAATEDPNPLVSRTTDSAVFAPHGVEVAVGVARGRGAALESRRSSPRCVMARPWVILKAA